MSFQAYIDNIQQKTGKTPDDFVRMAREKNLKTHAEVMAWLKSEFGLGHGHAMAIVALVLKPEQFSASDEQKMDALFSGKKAMWRAPAEGLVATVQAFGEDVSAPANETYINLLRGKKKFALLQPSSGACLDVGIKLKGVAPEGRFEAAGSWNTMVTHRVRVTDAAAIDAALVKWLRQAYDGI